MKKPGSFLFSGFHLFLAGLTLGLCGCAHRPQAEKKHGPWLVSLPPIHLSQNEYIESIKVELHCGRVVSVNHLPEDWSVSVEVDTPARQVFTGSAGHFPAGLNNSRQLNEFLTVRSVCANDGKDDFNITAKVFLSQAHPLESRTREISLTRELLLLKPTR